MLFYFVDISKETKKKTKGKKGKHQGQKRKSGGQNQ